MYNFPDMSASDARMPTAPLELKYTRRLAPPKAFDWKTTSGGLQSWYLVRAQFFLWVLASFNGTLEEARTTLFPTSITRKVKPLEYLEGLHRGFYLGATLVPLFRRYGSLSYKARWKFDYWDLIESALERSNLLSMINHGRFGPFLSRSGGDVIKSYPATNDEMPEVLRRWFLKRKLQDKKNRKIWRSEHVVCFADMNTKYIVGVLKVAEYLIPVYHKSSLSSHQVSIMNNGKDILALLGEYNETSIEEDDQKHLETLLSNKILPKSYIVDAEARHAAGDITESITQDYPTIDTVPYKETVGYGCDIVKADFVPQDVTDRVKSHIYQKTVKKIKCPLFSADRVIQLSTGAHYKYNDISKDFKLGLDGIFCGDGSGGIGANYARNT